MTAVLLWSAECLVLMRGDCRWPLFLTNWTNIVVTAYLICAAFMMLSIDETTTSAPPIVKVVWALQTVALPGSIVVVLMYWVLLAPTLDEDEIDLLDYLTHGFNGLAMLLDFFLSRQRFDSLHSVYYSLFGAAYVIFTLVLFLQAGCPSDANCDVDGQGNPYIYSVFDWRDPRSCVTIGLSALAGAFLLCQLFFAFSLCSGRNMGFM
eukprot:TRINITY_DN34996_c0_g1_i2.p1 TRINITY_DN34996_c0_g1~~TRINITY_DN34996_c0_g1_i2.p1  ORF type:complete len:207 (+),score=15.58 TRINITY_DN34996_c0_g1_i2:319-939(+)